ncbi:hypothetical protein [Micromonospora inyonensis]|uniref:hypothetical protein n=1 Tax=Micromonospora inyonensis TaxID=47866 RepID=UPI003CCBF2BF
MLCSFHQIEIWEPGKYPNAPLLAFPLTELPDRYESLMVLAGEESLFHQGNNKELTKAAATAVAQVYRAAQQLGLPVT